MKTNYLFPQKFRLIGWILFVPFACLGMAVLCDYSFDWNIRVLSLLGDSRATPWGNTRFFHIISNDVADEIAIIGTIVSLLFIAFSKEKDEDECIAKIRGESLVWAVIAHNIVVILGTMFIFDTMYFVFLSVNLVIGLLLFVIKYNFALYTFRKSIGNAE